MYHHPIWLLNYFPCRSPVRNAQGHTKPVDSVCWDPSGELLASVSEGLVRVWTLRSGSEGDCIYELALSGYRFCSCVFHPTYPSLLIVGCYQVNYFCFTFYTNLFCSFPAIRQLCIWYKILILLTRNCEWNLCSRWCYGTWARTRQWRFRQPTEDSSATLQSRLWLGWSLRWVTISSSSCGSEKDILFLVVTVLSRNEVLGYYSHQGQVKIELKMLRVVLCLLWFISQFVSFWRLSLSLSLGHWRTFSHCNHRSWLCYIIVVVVL